MSIILGIGPVISAFTCLYILTIGWQDDEGGKNHRLKKLLLLYFVFTILSWPGAIFDTYYTDIILPIMSVIFLFGFYVQVVFYHLVFTVTATGQGRFPFIHYLWPLLLTLTLFVWQQFIPADAFSGSVEGHVIIVTKYRGFAIFGGSMAYVLVAASLVYAWLGLRRLTRYRRRLLAAGPNEELRWCNVLIASTALMPLGPSFFPLLFDNPTVSSLLWRIALPLIMTQHSLLCYRITAGDRSSGRRSAPAGDAAQWSGGRIPTGGDTEAQLRERLERYMREAKPYLYPDLRITDLSTRLYTNRTYLSSFINRTYGMNFNQYVNSFRLLEFETMSVSPEFSMSGETELLLKAGFGSRKNYLRVKKVLLRRNP